MEKKLTEPSKQAPVTYDYIIAGAGLAGLSLALQLSSSAFFRKKRVLLLDKADKTSNDRTWCFWAKENEALPALPYRLWPQAEMHTDFFSKKFDLKPYQYHLLRSSDFYNFAKQNCSENFNWVKENIVGIDETNGIVFTDKCTYSADLIFNSAIVPAPIQAHEQTDLLPEPYFSTKKGTKLGKSSLLHQHFMGWYIKTEKPIFDANTIHLMDFRIEQEQETRFFYVLPFSSDRALVEFTLFSETILEKTAYEAAIRQYLSKYWKLDNYTIEETEFGVIPMTNFSFPKKMNGKTVHIGTAGGFVKASSGYTFLRTQRKITKLVEALQQSDEKNLSKNIEAAFATSRWKQFMDGVLLRVLERGYLDGASVFGALFEHCSPELILRFLDEDTSFWEDVQIAWAMPKWPFIRAIF